LCIACKGTEDLTRAIKVIAASVIPNGKLLFVEPIHTGFLHRVLNMDLKEFLGVISQAGLEIHDVNHLHFWPMRLALAYVSWPWGLTKAGYELGNFLMRLSNYQAWGDYQAIYAAKAQ
jgi:hypothetical protein